jgi:hypothetical protein
MSCVDGVRGGHRHVRTDYRGCEEIPAVEPVDPVFGSLQRAARTPEPAAAAPMDAFEAGSPDYASVLGGERSSAEDAVALSAGAGQRKDLWEIFDANLRDAA